jgi:hypothetical protein
MSSNEDTAARGGSARYGSGPATGSNEPKHGERKEQRSDWVHRQGGDQTRDGSDHDDASDPKVEPDERPGR